MDDLYDDNGNQIGPGSLLQDAIPAIIDQRVGDHFDMYFARFIEKEFNMTLTELKEIVKEHYPEKYI